MPFNTLTKGFHADEYITKRVLEVTTGLPGPIHLLGSEILSVDSNGYIDLDDFDKAKKK